MYGLEYGGHLCGALKTNGVATWSLEYRRVGDKGGGWPGTFQDVALGYDYLGTLARSYPLDLRGGWWWQDTQQGGSLPSGWQVARICRTTGRCLDPCGCCP